MQKTSLLLILAFAAPANPQPSQPPQAVQQTPSHQHDEMNARGDHAMGFSHDTTTHHFRLYQSGGAIEVFANDPKDNAARDQIRMHLSHIARKFSDGDFNIPMFIHSTTPPGAPTMTKLRNQILYQLQETTRGAKIQITTTNPEASEAVHAFLRFQISDHQTGDSSDVTSPPQ